MKLLYLVALLALFVPTGSPARIADAATCSDGWRITGYFTPVEVDYPSTETRDIFVDGAGLMKFNAQFLSVIFNEDKGFGEGWGKTRFGWYLGNYRGKWHKSDAPLGANDKPLNVNSVAVDNAYVPRQSVVEIPDLPGTFGTTKFISDDVGVSVHGKHIDVYTGEGKAAERTMYRITFEDDDDLQRVCFEPAPIPVPPIPRSNE